MVPGPLVENYCFKHTTKVSLVAKTTVTKMNWTANYCGFKQSACLNLKSLKINLFYLVATVLPVYKFRSPRKKLGAPNKIQRAPI